MSMKRGRPGSPAVRHGKSVGPDYPESKFRNPFNADVDETYEDNNTMKTLGSPTATTVGGVGLPMRDGYNSLWEGK